MRFIWPLATPWITRDFYYKSWLYVGGQHMALDFGAAKGTPILAVAGGTVSDRGIEYYSGNYIGIKHAEGWHTVYRHLVRTSPLAPGSPVVQGQVVGGVGTTGVSTGPHLHFDLWCKDRHSAEAIFKRNWWAHDPELYLGKEDDMTDEQLATILAAIATNDTNAQARRDEIITALNEKDAKDQARRDQILAAIAAIESSGGGGATPAEVLAMSKKALRDGGG